MQPAPAELARLQSDFPSTTIELDAGTHVSVRQNRTLGRNHEMPVVCLHGIGSGAASWLDLASLLAGRTRLIAWNAPGYAESTPLVPAAPVGSDYAQRLFALLDALAIQRCVLVGHSLGAVIAAAASHQPGAHGRVAALVLLSPAQGYGAPARRADQARVRSERLAALDELGIAGMAAQRSARLVSERALVRMRAWVQWNMAQLREQGYRQAIELLCTSDLLADLPPPVPVTVACGELDGVTTPARCAEVARRCGVALQTIAGAGHACYVERPDEVADLLQRALDGIER